MSFDALVWLLVGIGLGVAGCLMALLLYAALEGGRLRRRLRRARQAKPAPMKVEKVAPVVAKPLNVTPVTPAITPKAVEPMAAPVVVPVATAVETVAAVAVPVPAPSPAPLPTPAAPKPVQSVEALFAEAFAVDRLSPAPKTEDDRS